MKNSAADIFLAKLDEKLANPNSTYQGVSKSCLTNVDELTQSFGVDAYVIRDTTGVSGPILYAPDPNAIGYAMTTDAMGGIYTSEIIWKNGAREEIKNNTNVKEITDTYKKVIGAEDLSDAKNDASDITNSISTETTRYKYDGTPISRTGTDGSGNTFSEGFDSLGALTSYVFTKAGGGQMSLTGSDIGAVLGSSIGSALSKNNFATKVVATTLIGTLGQTLGGLLNIQDNAGKSLIAQVGGVSTLDSAFASSVSSFGKAVPINLLNNLTGSASSFLIGELANALGLKGFAAGAFTTVGTTITTQLVNNLVSMGLASQGASISGFNSVYNAADGLGSGFSLAQFGPNLAGAVGGYLGAYLATEIFTPKTASGQLGASIGSGVGSAIGSIIGTAILPGIGTGIGAHKPANDNGWFEARNCG